MNQYWVMRYKAMEVLTSMVLKTIPYDDVWRTVYFSYLKEDEQQMIKPLLDKIKHEIQNLREDNH